MKAFISKFPKRRWYHRLFNLEHGTRKASIELKTHDWVCANETIAILILPILEKLRADKQSYPVKLTEKQWDEKLDDMIFAFRAYAERKNDTLTDAEQTKVYNGLLSFAYWFPNLWS